LFFRGFRQDRQQIGASFDFREKGAIFEEGGIPPPSGIIAIIPEAFPCGKSNSRTNEKEGNDTLRLAGHCHGCVSKVFI